MTTNTSKPNWLVQLEAESWQAELIISGIALFASTYLPSLAGQLVNFCITTTDPSDSFLFYYLFIYFYIGIYVVIAGLVLHFVVRAFWIGLVGFNSVFPNGIDREHEGYYSKYFIQKITTSLPNNANHLIQQLDQFCSPIFAIVAFTLMTNIGFSLNLVGLYLLGQLLGLLLPAAVVKVLSLAFITLFALILVCLIVLNIPFFKQKKAAQHLLYLISDTVYRFIFHIFYTPMQYIIMTLYTNGESKKTIRIYFLGSMFFVLCSMPFVMNTNFIYLIDYNYSGLYLHNFDQPYHLLPEHYDNLRTPSNNRLFSASLASDKVKEANLEVFVPIFYNEWKLYEGCLAEKQVLDSLSHSLRTKKKHENQLHCYNRYHHLRIDEQVVQPSSSIIARHPNKNEYGIRFYIAMDSLSEGLHQLSIEKRDIESDTLFRRISLPFQRVLD